MSALFFGWIGETETVRAGTVSRPNPEDQIIRKPEDRKNDQRTKNAKNHKTVKMNSTVLNLKFSLIFTYTISMF